MKKIVWPGLLAGLVMLVAGMLIGYLCGLIPTIAADYATPFIRPWSDPLMSLFFLYPFVLGVLLAWFWDKVKDAFRGSPVHRGFAFGWAYAVIAGVPGMLMTYSSFVLSIWTILSWLVSSFITAILGAMILAKMNK